MTTQELRQETDAFRRGYEDAFHGEANIPPRTNPTDRSEYYRGYWAGAADHKHVRVF